MENIKNQDLTPDEINEINQDIDHVLKLCNTPEEWLNDMRSIFRQHCTNREFLELVHRRKEVGIVP